MLKFISLVFAIFCSVSALADNVLLKTPEAKVCDKIKRLIKLDKENADEMKYKAEFKDHSVDFIENGEIDLYKNLDIDGDGKDDFVQRECGTSNEPVCIVNIRLTTGKKATSYFAAAYLTRVNNKIYVIEKFKAIYVITKKGIKPICHNNK